LGSSVSAFFTKYATKLCANPLPDLGFFLMDHPTACGVYGLRFSYYHLMQNVSCVNRFLQLMVEDGDFSTSTSGSFINTVVIRHGNRRRWNQLVDEASLYVPSDWQDQLDNNAQWLYNRPTDKLQSSCRIISRLFSPNVVSSLSHDGDLTRIISMSVYMIAFKALIKVRNFGNEAPEKKSLYRMLHDAHEMTGDKELSVDQKRFLFPFFEEYESGLQTIETIARSKLIRWTPRRKVRAAINVLSESKFPPVTLEKMCAYKWFGQGKLPCSNTQANAIWATYKNTFPWLRDTEIDTRAEACMDHAIQLRNLVARVQNSQRNLKLVTVPLRSGGMASVQSLLSRNYQNGYLRSMTYNERLALKMGEDRGAAKSILNKICLSALWTTKQEDHNRWCHQLILRGTRDWTSASYLSSSKARELQIMSCWLKYIDNPNDDTLLAAKTATLTLKAVAGMFVQRQRFSELTRKYEGDGVWLGVIGAATVRISSKQNTIVRIETNNVESLLEDGHLLTRTIKDIGWEPKKGAILSHFPLYLDSKAKVTLEATHGVGIEIKKLSWIAKVGKVRFEAMQAAPGTTSMMRIFGDDVTFCSIRLVPGMLLTAAPKAYTDESMLTCWRDQIVPAERRVSDPNTEPSLVYKWLTKPNKTQRERLIQKELLDSSLEALNMKGSLRMPDAVKEDSSYENIEKPMDFDDMLAYLLTVSESSEDSDDEAFADSLGVWGDAYKEELDHSFLWDALRTHNFLNEFVGFWKRHFSREDMELFVTANEIPDHLSRFARVLNEVSDKTYNVVRKMI